MNIENCRQLLLIYYFFMQMKLSKERDSLAATTKKLSRDLAKVSICENLPRVNIFMVVVLLKRLAAAKLKLHLRSSELVKNSIYLWTHFTSKCVWILIHHMLRKPEAPWYCNTFYRKIKNWSALKIFDWQRKVKVVCSCSVLFGSIPYFLLITSTIGSFSSAQLSFFFFCVHVSSCCFDFMHYCI